MELFQVREYSRVLKEIGKWLLVVSRYKFLKRRSVLKYFPDFGLE
jgi:hypothetical protein